MRHLITFLLFSVAAPLFGAAPVVDRVVVDFVDYSAARINVRATATLGAATFYVTWGYTDATTTIDPFLLVLNCETNTAVSKTQCSSPILSVIPGSTVYFQVHLLDGGVEDTTWGCSGGSITEGTMTGATCGAMDDWPHFAMASNPGPWDKPYPDGWFPQQPTVPSMVYPSSPTVFTVASDCSDLDAVLAAAVVANVDAEVRLPVSTTASCGVPTLPAKSLTHTIVITTATTDNVLSPPGMRVTLSHAPVMAKVVGNPGAMAIPAGRNGYIFRGVQFTTPWVYPTVAVPALVITQSESGNPGTDTLWKFTITGTLPATVTAGSLITVDGVATLNSECHAGFMSVWSRISATAFDVYCGAAVVPGSPDTTPGRSVVTATVQQIAGITPGACAGGNAQLSLAVGSAWGMPDNTVIQIMDGAGIAGGLNNRGWRVATASGRNICLQNSSGLSGTYVANTAKYALDSNANQLVFSQGLSENVWFDRCIFDGQPWPNKTYIALGLSGLQQSGVVNSIMRNIGGWAAIDPATGVWQTYSTGLGILTGIALEMTATDGILVKNNYIQGNGILMFPQQHTVGQGPQAENITITRNYVNVPSSKMAAGTDWTDGMYWPHRHVLECKTCKIVNFYGNYVDGNWSDDVSAAPTVTMTPRQLAPERAHDPTTETGGIRDITVKNNYFTNIAGGISWSFSSDSSVADTSPTVRVAVQNNYFGSYYWKYRSTPSGGSGASPNNSITGGTMFYDSLAHSQIMDHNTVYLPWGYTPRLFSNGGTMIPFWRFTNNIWVENKPIDPPVFWGCLLNPSSSYACLEVNVKPGKTAAQMWPYVATQWNASNAIEADPNSLYAGNIIVPGSENNFDGNAVDASCYSSTAGDCNITQAERDAYFGTTSSSTVTYANVPFSGTTPNARYDQMLWQNRDNNNFKLRWDSPGISGAAKSSDGQDNGANLSKIHSAIGMLESGSYFVDGATKKVRYNAPFGEACYLKPSNSLTSGTWTSDSGTTPGPRNTTVTLGGATTVWLYCGSQLYSCTVGDGPCVLQAN